MRYTIEGPDGLVPVTLTPQAEGEGAYMVQIGEADPEPAHVHIGRTMIHVLLGHRSFSIRHGARGKQLHVHGSGYDQVVSLIDPKVMRRRLATGHGAGSGGVICSPMPGKVVQILVEVGQEIEAGQGVIIVEAMKMENELRAEEAGVVLAINVAPGDLVEGQAALIQIGPLDAEG